jgi:hypothetical protein
MRERHKKAKQRLGATSLEYGVGDRFGLDRGAKSDTDQPGDLRHVCALSLCRCKRLRLQLLCRVQTEAKAGAFCDIADDVVEEAERRLRQCACRRRRLYQVGERVVRAGRHR